MFSKKFFKFCFSNTLQTRKSGEFASYYKAIFDSSILYATYNIFNLIDLAILNIFTAKKIPL